MTKRKRKLRGRKKRKSSQTSSRVKERANRKPYVYNFLLILVEIPAHWATVKLFKLPASFSAQKNRSE